MVKKEEKRKKTNSILLAVWSNIIAFLSKYPEKPPKTKR
jgi:hypothetical protein